MFRPVRAFVREKKRIFLICADSREPEQQTASRLGHASDYSSAPESVTHYLLSVHPVETDIWLYVNKVIPSSAVQSRKKYNKAKINQLCMGSEKFSLGPIFSVAHKKRTITLRPQRSARIFPSV